MFHTILLVLTGLAIGMGYYKLAILIAGAGVLRVFIYGRPKKGIPIYCVKCRRMLGEDNPAVLRFVGFPSIWGRVCKDRGRCNRRGTQHVAEVTMEVCTELGVVTPDEHHMSEGEVRSYFNPEQSSYFLTVGKVTYAICPYCHFTGNSSSWVRDGHLLVHKDCVGRFVDQRDRVSEVDRKVVRVLSV